MHQNRVELLEVCGSDFSHARAAWASTNAEIDKNPNYKSPDKIANLLNYLADHNHGTPFEHSLLSFRVTGDIASHIHCLKHRTGVSINCESARYKELKEDLYYLPDDWPDEELATAQQTIEQCHALYHQLIERLEPVVGRKRAKESARLVLPYAHQLRWVMSMNFRAFVHFYTLRAASDAQLEIQQIAEGMLKLIRQTGKFPHSLRAHSLIE
jgi:thymidylate synthase (FAD)